MAIGCQFGKATYLPGQWSDLREIGLLKETTKDMIHRYGANYCSSSSQCKTVNFEEIKNGIAKAGNLITSEVSLEENLKQLLKQL